MATPLYDEDTEAAVLGELISAPQHAPEIAQLVAPADFYLKAHEAVYQAIIDNSATGKPVDTATLSTQLRGTVHASLIQSLPMRAIAVANVAHHARTVHADAQHRRLLSSVQQASQALQNGGLEPAARTELIQRLTDAPAIGQAQRVHGLDLAELLATQAPDIEWVWDGYLAKSTLSVLHGDGGTGKSLMAGALCRAHATAATFLGQPTTKGHSLILDAENPLPEIQRRVHRLAYATAPQGAITYARVDEPILNDPGGLSQLEQMIRHHSATLVILDSQRGLWGADENEQIEIRPLYRQLQAIAERTNSAVVMIHHDNKGGGYSGSSDINNAVDTRLQLTRPDPEKAERKLMHQKSRSAPEQDTISYTFALDHETNTYAFGQPQVRPDATTMILEAIPANEWLILPEIADLVSMRQAETRTLLWRLTKEGHLEHQTGPLGRSKRAKCWRRRTHYTDPDRAADLTLPLDPSQQRDGSGRVAESAPAAPIPDAPPLLRGASGWVEQPDASDPSQPGTGSTKRPPTFEEFDAS